MIAPRTLTLAAVVALAAHQPAAAEDRCYDWSDAAPIVASEKLASARQIHELTRARLGGDPLRITLCSEGNRYVYRLLVQGGGKVQNVVVDARRPFEK